MGANAFNVLIYSFLHLLEKPGDGAADAEATALVHLGVEPHDLARASRSPARSPGE